VRVGDVAPDLQESKCMLTFFCLNKKLHHQPTQLIICNICLYEQGYDMWARQILHGYDDLREKPQIARACFTSLARG
jgi:hypothetical protein